MVIYHPPSQELSLLLQQKPSPGALQRGKKLRFSQMNMSVKAFTMPSYGDPGRSTPINASQKLDLRGSSAPPPPFSSVYGGFKEGKRMKIYQGILSQ